MHLVCRAVCVPLPHLSWVYWQGVIINPFSPGQGVRIMPFWIRLLLTLNKDWTPSSLIHLRHWKWTLPWGSLMPLHLQSLLGFSAQLVPFLIILHHSLLLAFILINCGARLGLFLTQSTSFLISRLPWWILFPHCQRLREMLYLCLKCMNYFSGFMAFCIRLFPSE